MPVLILKYEERVLREIPLGEGPVTIGRLPDNQVALDNPAVSSRHARVVRESSGYVVEDLKSRNGTFVDGLPVSRHALTEGNVIRIGKHTLVYSAAETAAMTPPAAERAPAAPVQELGGTVFLDTREHRETLARMKAVLDAQAAAAGVTIPPVAVKTGVLTVVSGRTDRQEYVLEAQTTLVGRDRNALVRLRGWFKPKVAAAITRRDDSYILTPLAGPVFVQEERAKQARVLRPGDVVRISGVTFQFSLR